jgi:hypothetical protein
MEMFLNMALNYGHHTVNLPGAPATRVMPRLDSPFVIASDAKQSRATQKGWIASS